MALGGKIDKVTRPGQHITGKNKHPPRLHFARFAGALIGGKIIRVGFFELQSNAFAHHAFGIDRIN